MGHLVLIAGFVLFAVAHCAVTWTVTPFNPPAVPLAVRSPYLSIWLPQGSGNALNAVWPTFWTGQTIGWAGYIRVDGKPYTFMGQPNIQEKVEAAVQKSMTFTSTQSIFVLTAGPVELTAQFLSPVEPRDLLKHSLPFSYLSLSVKSTDGQSHIVSLYTDISGEYVSGDTKAPIRWETKTDSKYFTHQVSLQNQTRYEEDRDVARYGTGYFSTEKVAGVTFKTGGDADTRSQFVGTGKLDDRLDVRFRAVEDNWPVFAYAREVGSVGADQSTPWVISVGHVRDPAVQYIVADGKLQERSSYFLSEYNDPLSAVTAFHDDFNDALDRARAFDSQVDTDASKISSEYAGIVALSIRQAFGATELTVSKNADGSYNKDDVLMFMKEISSNGNTNTVDVIFPAWPLYLYTNPLLGKHLLEALFRYQATGQYPNRFSIHDIGTHYPKAIGHNDGRDEAMPVEESGNMIIMSLSYAERTGDNSHLTKYGDLLDQWAQFLISDSLVPEHQLSTDDFAGPLANQTNLAIKGIIGIKAMSKIAERLGDSGRAANYSEIASRYVEEWQTLAMSSNQDHLTLSYGNSASWGLTYNLYADKFFNFNLFPQSIYEMQTVWYERQMNNFGVPLDTRHSYTKSDWLIWTAGIMTTTSMRDNLVKAYHKWLSSGSSSQPMGDWYGTLDGKPEGFRARPVAGGHLALMVLLGDAPTVTTTALPEATGTSTTTAGTRDNSAPSMLSTFSSVAAFVLTITTVMLQV